jgi:hypothetical protein
MQWNELDWDTQMIIVDRISSLLSEDDEMNVGIIAAISELEIWSNSPCTVMEADPFVSLASDQESNDKPY